MIRTESGGRVPASYRSGRYDEWRKRNAADAGSDDEHQDKNRKKAGKWGIIIIVMLKFMIYCHLAG